MSSNTPLLCGCYRLRVRRRGTQGSGLDIPILLLPFIGAFSRRSTADAQAQWGKPSEGDGAISSPQREVLGYLGAVHVLDDGASFFKVWAPRSRERERYLVHECIACRKIVCVFPRHAYFSSVPRIEAYCRFCEEVLFHRPSVADLGRNLINLDPT